MFKLHSACVYSDHGRQYHWLQCYQRGASSDSVLRKRHILTQFSPNPSLLAFNFLLRWTANWAKLNPQLNCSAPSSLMLQVLVWFCELTVMLAGMRALCPSPLWKCPGEWGFRGGWLLGVRLYCAFLYPIQLCCDLAGLLCPLGRAREGEVEGHDPCGARVGCRC